MINLKKIIIIMTIWPYFFAPSTSTRVLGDEKTALNPKNILLKIMTLKTYSQDMTLNAKKNKKNSYLNEFRMIF